MLLRNKFAFCLPDREQALGYPVDGGRGSGVLARMRADATSLLAPPFVEVMTKTRQPLLQAIVDLETPAMVVGRVALLGDAAFVARPHVGMGTTKAASDARALADHMARHDDIDAALAATTSCTKRSLSRPSRVTRSASPSKAASCWRGAAMWSARSRVRRCWHRGIASGGAFVCGPAMSTAHRSALVSVAQDEQRAVACFDDGSEVAADLLVAADGVQSTVRRQLLPAVEPRYAGYVASRGLADMAELSREARDLLRSRAASLWSACRPARQTSRSLYASSNRLRGGAATSATFPQAGGGDD
jgi:2-polyprenyl-6-methoxyphenol hydroxylase-like FAD-dependent oxidoreductase